MTQIQMMHIAFEAWAAIFCSFAIIIVFLTKSHDKSKKLTMVEIMATTVVLNISESLAYFYRGNASSTGHVMVRVTNFVVFLCGYFLVIEAAVFLNKVITLNTGRFDYKFVSIVGVTQLIGIILLICSRIWKFYYAFDESNRYYRLGSHWIMIFIALTGMSVIFIETIMNFKNLRPIQGIAFICFEIMPIFAMIFQINHYGISIYNLAITISVVFLCISYFVDNSIIMNDEERKLDQEKIRLLEKEVELNREKVKLYHSQIHPHFIFNTLTMLRSYLDEPDKAEEILNSFTAFLRNSVDLFSESESVPLSREMGIVENYLYLCKERFGNKISINMDIQDMDFKLPPFTVQTVVENAIVHGIRKRKDGQGSLAIKSYKDEAYHVIEVEDDGIGFDVNILKNKELQESFDDIQHKHIGLDNVEKRLELMSSGKMEITSIIDKGTKVTIRIPV
ncbi:MAG: histidine kinase [Butyrivibrio sp.]|nr:histidine kinase [Butyrivibrio sp.]